MDKMIRSFDRIFADHHQRSLGFLTELDPDVLFRRPRELARTYSMFSVGEYITRSAAEVEKTIGGITTRLWDDPFEWTLPEELHSIERVAGYLADVESSRQKGFAFFTSDADLQRSIPAPERLLTIFEILTQTLVRSSHFQGRAYAVSQWFSDKKLPQL